MGRSPCCDKVGLKKGPWTPEEDQKLLAYIEEHGHGSWRALPAKAGLPRCGKSCRLRWTNYLRPDIKRGKFSLQEEQTIIQLHALLGNRWSAIATHLPKRTDNEIKNYWNTHLKKRLAKMGIDPVTHKPKSDTLGSFDDGQNKNAANLSHMAQWESARLEAEARLVRESTLRSASAGSSSLKPPATAAQSLCLDVLKAWQGVWPKSNKGGIGGGHDLESPTSTLSFSPIPTVDYLGENPTAPVSLMDGSSILCKEESEEWKCYDSISLTDDKALSVTGCNGIGDANVTSDGSGDGNGNGCSGEVIAAVDDIQVQDPMSMSMGTIAIASLPTQQQWSPASPKTCSSSPNFIDGFTDLLLHNSDEDKDDHSDSTDGDDDEANNYWSSILNLVNSSPSHSQSHSHSHSPLF